MICPKCYVGTIESVILKVTAEEASLCDYCGIMWLKGEDIKDNSGHPFDILTQGNAIEYTIEPSLKKDQDHTEVRYKLWK